MPHISEKCIKGIAVFIQVALFFFTFQNSSLHAATKNYKITHVAIQAQLQPDGSMVVQETRAFRFKGHFHFAYRTFPRNGRVKFADFSVLEGNHLYSLSQSKKPGTYEITPKKNQTEIRWFFDARNQTRTFTIKFKAENAVQRYEDAAVLYYKFISEDWRIGQQGIEISLKPPVSLAQSSVKEWLHGPLWASSRTGADGAIYIQCARLPQKSYLEIRALYPPEIFPGQPLIQKRIKNEILQEEAKWAVQANQMRQQAIQKEESRRQRKATGKWVVIGLSLFGLWLWWRIYQKYGKRPRAVHKNYISSDIPQHLPPAFVGYLMNNRQIYGNALMGTILNFAKMGILSFYEDEIEKKSLWGKMKKKPRYSLKLNREAFEKQKENLMEFEKRLILFLFDGLAGGNASIDLESIRKNRSKFLKFFRNWKKDVQNAAKTENWFDEISNKGMLLSTALGIGLLILVVPAAFIVEEWAIVLGVAGFLIFVLSFVIPHRTKEGETLAQQWKALKKYLQKTQFLKGDHSRLLDSINDYLIYSVTLGVPRKAIQKLVEQIPAETHHHYIGWYVYGGQGVFSPQTFSQSFLSAISATASTLSSASGAGGGASAGGGAGAGSGGGGAG